MLPIPLGQRDQLRVYQHDCCPNVDSAREATVPVHTLRTRQLYNVSLTHHLKRYSFRQHLDRRNLAGVEDWSFFFQVARLGHVDNLFVGGPRIL